MNKRRFHRTGLRPCSIHILLLLFLLLPVIHPDAFAQDVGAEEAGRPFITNYSPADYGAGVQNWAIVQDDRGVMYFGNNSGVLEYDGATWRLIEVPNRTVVRSLVKGADGMIYVGAVGDLGYLAPDSLGRMQFVSLVEVIPEDFRDFADVWNSDVIGDEIYFNVGTYVFRWDGEEMHVYPAEVAFHLTRAVGDEYFLRQWEVGLMRLEGDELRLIPGGEQFAQERIYVMLPFGDGRVLLGTRTRGLFLSDGERIMPFETEADDLLEESGLYYPGVVLPGGRFALGTFSDGLVVIDREGQLIHHVDRTSGLRDNVVLYTFVDRDGALWLGLDNGLARIEVDAPLSYYDAADGLASNVLSLERHDGALYAGTSTGLYRLDGPNRRFVEIEGGGLQVFDLLSAGDDLLVASFDGVKLLDGERARFVYRSESGSGIANRLHHSKQDSSRIFASATGDGLIALRRSEAGTWAEEGSVHGTSDVEIWSITEPTPGTIWLGTTADGVLRVQFPRASGMAPLESAEVTAFGSEHGLPASSIQVGQAGETVFFMTKDGLFRFDSETERFTPDSTTFAGIRIGGDPEEWTIREAEDGIVWLNFGRETAVAYPQEDGTYGVETASFRRFAGLSTAAINPDADGTLWLGGTDRLVRFERAYYDARESEPYPTLLRRVTTSEGRPLFGGGGTVSRVELPPHERTLRFEYAAPRYVEAGRTEYQVMLDGFDAHASGWSRETAKEYTNLSPGAYTFRVRARDVTGLESTEAAYNFSILAPWYATPWAYLLYVLAAGGLVFGVVRARTHQLEARSRELEEIVRTRTAELEQRVEELAVINGVQRGLVAALDISSIYDLVGDRIREIFDAQSLVISTFDHEADVEQFRYRIERGEKGDQGVLQTRSIDVLRRRLIDTREPILIKEGFIDAIVAMGDRRPEPVPGTEMPKSALYVPMVVGDSVQGYVSLQNIDREYAYDEADMRLLTTLANSMSVALENARLFAETTRRASELDTVNRISRALVAQLDFDALVALVGEQIRQTFRADIVYLALLDREAEMINFPYAHGDDLSPLRLGEGLTSRIIRTGEPLLINEDVTGSYEQLGLEEVGLRAASYLGVPIAVGDEAIGVISVQSTTEQGRFGPDDLRLLTTIAANVGVAIQNAEAYRHLADALHELKATQQQLVQQEKLASLGALTAGIAHEIKNPLNFVNNFASLSTELVDEIEVSLRGDSSDVAALLADLRINAMKIEEHGRRADGIVRSMLEHSRGAKGERRPVDLNALVDEYVGLAYHGKRAQAIDFNVTIDRDYDEAVGDVEVVPQEIGRVLINLLGNAFDALYGYTGPPSGDSNAEYTPTVRVVTRRVAGAVTICIEDNGQGIPPDVRQRIFEPFFTTKPSGAGTGLGLSMSHEIVTQGHGGTLTLESADSAGASFTIKLPANQPVAAS